MMDRAQRHGTRAIQVTREPTHPTIPLDGFSEDAGAYRAAGVSGARRFVHALGALMSMAVIGAGGYWGYQQIMRDMHGVPVVRALEGPMRVAPDDPGGMVASHSGLAVNDVQAVGSAAAPEERLVLAPAPVDLSDEDLSTAELRGDDETVLANAAEADDADLVADGALVAEMVSLNEAVEDDDPVARALALAASSSAGAVPLSATGLTAPEAPVVPDTEGGQSLEELVEEIVMAVVTEGADGERPQRPVPRPTNRAPATPAENAPALPAVVEASAVPVGTRLVQLGAFDSPEDAHSAWDRIATRFDALMADKTQVVVSAEAGGRTFWRLRAMGFNDLSEARRFCAALVAERTDCIPVVAR